MSSPFHFDFFYITSPSLLRLYVGHDRQSRINLVGRLASCYTLFTLIMSELWLYIQEQLGHCSCFLEIVYPVCTLRKYYSNIGGCLVAQNTVAEI